MVVCSQTLESVLFGDNTFNYLAIWASNYDAFLQNSRHHITVAYIDFALSELLARQAFVILLLCRHFKVFKEIT